MTFRLLLKTSARLIAITTIALIFAFFGWFYGLDTAIDHFSHEIFFNIPSEDFLAVFFSDLFAVIAAAATFALFHIYDSPTRKEKILYSTGYALLFITILVVQIILDAYVIWLLITMTFLWSLALETHASQIQK